MRQRVTALAWRVAVRREREIRALRQGLLRVLGGLSWLMRKLPGTSWRFGPPRRYTFATYDWAGADGHGERREVDPASTTDRVPVKALGQLVPHQFSDSLRWKMPHTYVLILDDARIWGRDAVVITADDTVLADQTNAFRVRPEELSIMRRGHLGRPEKLSGVSATMCAAYSQSYYHWMFDLLPRLGVLQRSGIAVDRVIAPISLGFQKETLAAAGFGVDVIEPYAADRYLQAERLVFPSMPGTPGQSPPVTCEFLRGLFANSLRGHEQHRRLYLSRADVNRRMMANEAEVLAALEPLGFEAITMAGRTVAEQAALMAQAEVVIAPHGGALTNLVFCQPGTKVVELFPAGYTPVCFWTITAALELEYRPLFDDAAQPHDGIAQWLDYRVAPERVVAALADLGV